MGKSPVGRVFLRQENLLRGRYFAELTRELFDNLVWVRVRVRVRVRVSY